MINLHFGNCLTYLRTLPADTFDACITDLPYNTTQAKWDKRKRDEFLADLAAWISEINRVTKNKLFITTSNQPFTTDLINANRQYWRDELVWDKVIMSGPLNAKHRPLRQHETIQIFYDKKPHYTTQFTYGHKPYAATFEPKNTSTLYGKQSSWTTISNGERYPGTILRVRKVRGKHPTKKPEELYRWLIRSYTRLGDHVLDPFCGEGTTLLSAAAEDRLATGCELDPMFYTYTLHALEKYAIPYTELPLL